MPLELTEDDRAEVNKVVANAIRSLRKLFDISQIEAVLSSGISYSHLSKIEAHAKMPSISMLYQIAKSHDCELVIEFRRKSV